jgi:two-component system nitrogen regulation response regulator GlnG
MSHLLIVDDEQSICWALGRLAKQLGHSVETAASAEEGLKSAKAKTPNIVFLDVRLPGMDGLTAMSHFHEIAGPDVKLVIMTAHGQLDTAVDAVRNGAFDYLTKPFDLKTAELIIHRALQREPTASAPEPLEAQSADDSDERIVGKSPALQEVFKQIALVAPSEACVHLVGESGSGKELIARAIHRYSRRANGPFIAVNVAALNPSLAESELFGHVRGAFTGAESDRIGRLEQANGGTMFLDEVSEIPPAVQVKLLRALERREVWPVGGSEPRQSDFRLISATHQDLQQQVGTGAFRHDLYYRLMIFQIVIPPLRERGDDILELSEYFLDQLSRKNQTPRSSLSSDTMAELQRRVWHGNVRELRNTIESAMILAHGSTIDVSHLPAATAIASLTNKSTESSITQLVDQWTEQQINSSDEVQDLYERFLELVEPPMLEVALQKYQNQCAAAARKLGIHRTTLRKKLDQYGIGKDD